MPVPFSSCLHPLLSWWSRNDKVTAGFSMGRTQKERERLVKFVRDHQAIPIDIKQRGRQD